MKVLVRATALRIPLADRSVHCCVTSPPYYGLRDYGIAGQIGLERTPEAYVARLVEVFREVRRVLRDDGTCWVNMGDSYASSGISGKQDGFDEFARRERGQVDNGPKSSARTYGRAPTPFGLKPKDLIGIPWRVAFALQADGWYLRSEIIWAKPNPMPESVHDRPTKGHEQVFLLAKRERYFYDADSIKEPALNTGGNGRGAPGAQHKIGDARRDPASRTDCPAKEWIGTDRNRRSVWTIPSHPFSGAHFAVMPVKLVATCIKAGTSAKGACPQCGAAWERICEHLPMVLDRSTRTHEMGRTRSSGTMPESPRWKMLGWRPSCSCPEHTPIPCVVFDPFGGAATTVVAANALGRRGIALELSPKYLAIARRRLERPHARPENGHAAEPLMPLFAGLDP